MKCTNCEHCVQKNDTGYYPYPECDLCGKEIKYGLENGYERMKWCPLVSEEDKRDELIMRIRSALSEIHPFMVSSTARTEHPTRYLHTVSKLEDALKDCLEVLSDTVEPERICASKESFGKRNCILIVGTCPVCGQGHLNNDDHKFCGGCGRKLNWDDLNEKAKGWFKEA